MTNGDWTANAPRIGRRTFLAGVGVAGAVAGSPVQRVQAQPSPVVRVGVLNDASGPFRDTGGALSLACARQAVQDFGTAAAPFTVEVLYADHQNNPDLGSSLARRWFDRDGVDAVLDVPNSAVALAVSSVAREKNKVMITTGSASTDLTGPQCSPNTVQWAFDTYMMGKSTGSAIAKLGGKRWFFISADYTFGRLLQDSTAQFAKQGGGTVVGSVAYPFPGTTDFSSYLVQASSSGADVIGLATPGADLVDCVKQAAEFGMTGGKFRFAGLGMVLPEVQALGLDASRGLLTTESFYWDMNERTRAVTARIRSTAGAGSAPPCMQQAGTYAGVLHYLKAVADLNGAKADGAAVVARMKAMPTDDDCFGKATVRADGKAVIAAYLFEVKQPGESKGPWDFYKLVATTPPDQAWMRMAEEGCPLVRA